MNASKVFSKIKQLFTIKKNQYVDHKQSIKKNGNITKPSLQPNDNDNKYLTKILQHYNFNLNCMQLDTSLKYFQFNKK